MNPALLVPIAVMRHVTGVLRGTQLCSQGLCQPTTVYGDWLMNVPPVSSSVLIMRCVRTLTTIISVFVRPVTLKLVLYVKVGILCCNQHTLIYIQIIELMSLIIHTLF